MFDFLKKVPLFSGLSGEDLKRLCRLVREVSLAPGEELFTEGTGGDYTYVIREGRLEIFKRSGGREVFLAVRQEGEVVGEIALLEDAPRMATARALTACRLLAIGRQGLEELLGTSPSAARTMLRTVAGRLRETEMMLQQNEKLAQLGRLTAGLAHELNNPAAAAGRGAEQLRGAITRLLELQARLQRAGLTVAQEERLSRLAEEARERAARPLELDTLQRGDRETEVERWLEQRRLFQALEHAIELVNMGYAPPELSDLERKFPAQALADVIAWLCATFTSWSLIEEIVQGTAQITAVVRAMKSYVYLDQAPIQAIDLHEGLDNTLVILRGKLKRGITVRREYAPDLPRVQAYGSELNQVWTNLIDNAADALEGKGRIIIRTRQVDRWVVVEIEDDGPGISEAALPQLFAPFYTTKPVGQGTGLGLHLSYNIVQKHRGAIQAESRPGRTVFRVRLPVNLAETQGAAAEGDGRRPSG